MLSPASPPGPALGPALREGLKPGPGPSPTFKARARPELVFLGPDPSLLQAIWPSGHWTLDFWSFGALGLCSFYPYKCYEPPNIGRQMAPLLNLDMPIFLQTKF